MNYHKKNRKESKQLSLLNGENTSSQEDSDISQYLSSEEEVRRAVERNAIDRGVLFIDIIVDLQIDEILDEISNLVKSVDKEDIRENAEQLGINPEALDALDSLTPNIPYVYYFSTPEMLVSHPRLTFYYRNLAMLSDKVMRGIGLSTSNYEAGAIPSMDKAADISHYLNNVISGLIMHVGLTKHRHVEMFLTNIGESLGGSSRNEVGRKAMAQVMKPLILHLVGKGELESIIYSTRDSLVPGSDRDNNLVLTIVPGIDIENSLSYMEENFVKYNEIHLKNGVKLMVDKQIIWYDDKGKRFNPSADLHSMRELINGETDVFWGAEVKGGADPAGSDEHWKTASRALSRIIEDASKSGHVKPPLSFIGTTIVATVAQEIKDWMDRGDLVSAYNLTKMLEIPEEMKRFLTDMEIFLSLDNS